MIQIEFSPTDKEQLRFERYHYPHPQVQKKMDVLYLKSKGLPHKEICDLRGISKTTLTVYLRQYQADGLEGLKRLNYKGQPSTLNPHAETLKTYFEKHPPRKVAEAQAKIEELTGIKRSPTQIRAFLKRLGLSCRKVGFVPGKSADPDKLEEQETFRIEKLEPRLAEAKAGERTSCSWMQPILYIEPIWVLSGVLHASLFPPHPVVNALMSWVRLTPSPKR